MPDHDAFVLARRVRARRRVVVRVGFALLFLVSAVACFDQSTYQGGGRRDIGGQIAQVDSGSEGELEPEPEPTTEPTTEPPDSGSVLPPLLRDADADTG